MLCFQRRCLSSSLGVHPTLGIIPPSLSNDPPILFGTKCRKRTCSKPVKFSGTSCKRKRNEERRENVNGKSAFSRSPFSSLPGPVMLYIPMSLLLSSRFRSLMGVRAYLKFVSGAFSRSRVSDKPKRRFKFQV